MTEPDRLTAGSAPLLEMHGIVKTFPGVRALDGVDLDVRAGEVHCLLGQNGAGKSTLIKVLAGAHQPDAGRITWRGEEVAPRQPAGRHEPGHRDDLPGARPGLRPHRRRQHLPGPREVPVRHHPPGGGEQGGVRAAHPARPPRDPAHRRGRFAVGRLAADGQHRPRAVAGREAHRHGRAVRRPGQRGGRAALRRRPRPHRPRRRRRLHLPPAGGDPPDRRPDHRPQGRPHRRHRAARPRDPDPRGHHADDRPRPSSTSSRSGGPRSPPTRPRCSRSRGWACAGSFARRLLQPSAPARSSAWPAWWVRGARRSSRPSSAPAGRPPAPSASAGRSCATATSAARSPPASGSRPRSARARRCCSATPSTATSASPAWPASPAAASSPGAPSGPRPRS